VDDAQQVGCEDVVRHPQAGAVGSDKGLVAGRSGPGPPWA